MPVTGPTPTMTMPRLLATLALFLVLIGCSTPRTRRVSPDQAELLRSGAVLEELSERRERLERDSLQARSELERELESALEGPDVRARLNQRSSRLAPGATQLSEYLASTQPGDAGQVLEGLEPEQVDQLASEVVALQRDAGAGESVGDPTVLETLQNRQRGIETQRRAVQRDESLLQDVEAGEVDFFTDKQLYFSIEPLIAIRPGIEAVAVPCLGVNYRPFECDYSALALQLVVGGALNPSSSEGSARGAIGLGLAYPVAGAGAISAGVVFYDDDLDGASAPYLSITLGDFGEKRSRSRR
jgi:hypothetical protein